MIGLIIIVCFTALLGLVLWWFDRKNHPAEPKKENENIIESEPSVSEPECCGLHIVCEKESLSPFTTEIEYYEDEELDRFAGRSASDYSEEEIEEWRDILLTLRTEEIAGWARSIQLRELEMPTAIRDELLLIIAEARIANP